MINHHFAGVLGKPFSAIFNVSLRDSGYCKAIEFKQQPYYVTSMNYVHITMLKLLTSLQNHMHMITHIRAITADL